MSLQKENKILVISFYVLLLYVLLAQGGYFTIGLLALNIVLLGFVLLVNREFTYDFNMIILLIFFCSTGVSAFFLANSGYIAMSELLKYSLFPLSYFVFLNVKILVRIDKIFYHFLVLSCVMGVLSYFGIIPIDAMILDNEKRMHSFFHYANTTAMLMAIGVLLSVDYFFKTKNKWYGIIAFVFIGGLLLTKSRTGFVVFMIVAFLYSLHFLHRKGKIFFLCISLIILISMNFLGMRVLQVSLYEPTLVERLITFHDALIILKDNIGGLGLGDWQFEQFTYQSAPYAVQYIHNFYLQVALDSGVLTSILWACFIVYNLIMSRKSNPTCFYMILFIALHTFFDVHLNFGFVIVFFMFICSMYEKKKCVFKIEGRVDLRKKCKFILLLPLLLLSVFLISEYSFYQGEFCMGENQKEKAHTAFQRAYKWNLYNYDAIYQLGTLSESAILYEKALEMNPYDIKVIVALINYYSAANDFNKAYYYAKNLLVLNTFSIESQDIIKKIVAQFYRNEVIDKEVYEITCQEIDSIVLEKNSKINSLYRYINPTIESR